MDTERKAGISSLTRPALLMGMLAATVVAIAPPLAYLLMEYASLSEVLTAEARAQSALLTRVVAHNPGHWRHDTERLAAAVIDVRNIAHRSLITDGTGSSLLASGSAQAAPTLAAKTDFLENGAAAGTVTVEGSLQPALWRSSGVALISALLGLGLFFPLYRVYLASIRHATAALEAREARFRELAAIASDWIWEQDARLRFTEHTSLGKSSYAPNTIIGSTRWELPIDLPEEVWAQHRADLAARRPFSNFEYRIRNDVSGEVRWFSVSGKPLFAPDGAFLGYRGTGRDITARREAEERFATLSKQLRIATEGAGIGIWRWVAEDERLYWDDLIYRHYHASREAYPNPYKVWAMSLALEDVQEALKRIVEVYEGRGSRHLDFAARLPDGSRRWFRAYAVAEHGVDGTLTGVVGTHWDITQEKDFELELRQHHEHLQELVEARTVALVDARDEAERANRAKSEFLANMSHELRTPMHGVLSFARLGQTRAASLPPEKVQEYFTHIADSGNRLLSLLNDLLDLSKLESGHMHMNYSSTDLATIARDAVSQLSALAAGRGVRLLIEGSDDAPLSADRERLLQVMTNLIGNAIKFTAADSAIRINWAAIEVMPDEPDARGSPGWRVTVIDAGPGIPAGEEEAIFDKFVQSSGTSTGAGGTGLGLAICREIISRHHGRISASNMPEGGACFAFALPSDPPTIEEGGNP